MAVSKQWLEATRARNRARLGMAGMGELTKLQALSQRVQAPVSQARTIDPVQGAALVSPEAARRKLLTEANGQRGGVSNTTIVLAGLVGAVVLGAGAFYLTRRKK